MPLAICLACTAAAQPATSPVPRSADVIALLAEAKGLEEKDPGRSLVLAQRATAAAHGLGDPALLRGAQNVLCNATAAVDAAAALPIAASGLRISRKANDARSSAGFLSCKG